MLSPAEIAAKYADVGAAKTKLPILKMFLLGIFAGMFIAFGAFGSQIASLGVTPATTGKLLGALVFPIGLTLVLVAGAELFTGNCLILIPVLSKKATVSGMLKNWCVVYLGNLVGGVLTAVTVTYSHSLSAYDGALAQSVVSTAIAKNALSFGDAFLRGILCNILVCLAVWMSFAATELAGKIIALFVPVTLFVLCGFEHSVANMFFIPVGIFASMEYGIEAGGLDFLSALVNNILPVTLGNIVGGSFVVGLVYWYVYLKDKK